MIPVSIPLGLFIAQLQHPLALVPHPTFGHATLLHNLSRISGVYRLKEKIASGSFGELNSLIVYHL